MKSDQNARILFRRFFLHKMHKNVQKKGEILVSVRLSMVKIIIITFIYIKLCAEYIKLRVKFWWK